MLKILTLQPIKESAANYDRIEKAIKVAFKELLYVPLVKAIALSPFKLLNALDGKSALLSAIESGRIRYEDGVFLGAFNAGISKELKAAGARWRAGGWGISPKKLTPEMLNAVRLAEGRFAGKVKELARQLEDSAKILPAEIAGRIQTAPFMESTLGKVDRQVAKTLQGITVPPQLTDSQRKRIATEWQENLELWITDFAAEEIPKLREQIQKSVFAGNRHKAVVAAIRASYGVTERKAKFLARQETSLLVTKFKETRYTDSGVTEYKWGCVAGSPNHPVRPSHKILEGKTFRWDDPPITTAPGEPARRNNPGQDWNCRCFARPIVKFKGS